MAGQASSAVEFSVCGSPSESSPPKEYLIGRAVFQVLTTTLSPLRCPHLHNYGVIRRHGRPPACAVCGWQRPGQPQAGVRTGGVGRQVCGVDSWKQAVPRPRAIACTLLCIADTAHTHTHTHSVWRHSDDDEAPCFIFAAARHLPDKSSSRALPLSLVLPPPGLWRSATISSRKSPSCLLRGPVTHSQRRCVGVLERATVGSPAPPLPGLVLLHCCSPDL